MKNKLFIVIFITIFFVLAINVPIFSVNAQTKVSSIGGNNFEQIFRSVSDLLKNISSFIVNKNQTASVGLVGGDNNILIYSFDQARAEDLSLSSNEGNLFGPSGTQGKYNDGLSFDGTNDYVEIPNSSSLNISGGFTLAAWVNYENTGNAQIIIGKSVNTTEHIAPYFQYSLHLMPNGTPRAFITNGSRQYTALASSPISAQVWHHLVATYDGSQLKLYIDGVLAKTTSVSVSLATYNTSVRIGANVASAENFKGKIDEVLIANRALTAEEISTLLNTSFENTDEVVTPPPPTNNAPILNSIGNKSVEIGQNLAFTVSATDSNNDVLTYTASSLPSGASFNSSTKIFSWTPTSGQVGSYQLNFTVSDGSLADSENINITVTSNEVIPPTTPPPPTTTSGTYYVRPGATGNNTGVDWNNAYSALPAVLARGSTYYLADGNYSGYTFDDAESGTQLIVIKKATATDHGTNTGWSSAYGDGQAVFTGGLTFKNDYYTVTGQKRNETNWQDVNAYGFKVTTGAGADVIAMVTSSYPTDNADNIRLLYLDIGGVTGTTYPSGPRRGLNILYGNHNNIYLGYSHIHNLGLPIKSQNVQDVTIEHNYFGPNWSKEVIAHQYGNNWIIRNNLFVDNLIDSAESGTADIGVFKIATGSTSTGADNWQIYGNIFANTGQYSIKHNDAVIKGQEVNGWKVYNNIINGIGGRQTIGTIAVTGSGNYAYNNIIANVGDYEIGSLYSSPTRCNANVCENNICYQNNNKTARSGFDCLAMKTTWSTTILPTVNPFVDSANFNFNLKSDSAGINAGKTLSTGYNNLDPKGNTRGYGGAWDIGAYEYIGGSTPPPPPPPATDTTAPTITGVSNSNLTYSSVTINWNTNEPATTQIEYGLSSSYGSQTIYSGSLTLEHSQTLTGLVPGTTYNFRVRSIDSSGNLALSGNYSFNTPALATYNLSVSASNGTVNRNPNQSTYNAGQSVVLTAVPNNGYIFSGWSGGVNNLNNPITIIMDSSKTISANFTLFRETNPPVLRINPPVIAKQNISPLVKFAKWLSQTKIVNAQVVWNTYEVSRSPISLNGTASDDSGIAKITWTNDRGGSGTALGTANWSISNIVLQPGANTITITAEDIYGNKTISGLILNYTPVVVDSTAPSAPASLTARVVSATRIDLNWNASTDNVGVAQYKVYRNNVLIASPTLNSFSDTGLVMNTTYSYFVKAIDANNNLSASSNVISAKTLDEGRLPRGKKIKNTTSVNIYSEPIETTASRQNNFSLAAIFSLFAQATSQNLTIIGNQPVGAVGIVIDGPMVFQGSTWWKIDYETGQDGWVNDSYLQEFTESVNQTMPVLVSTNRGSGGGGGGGGGASRNNTNPVTVFAPVSVLPNLTGPFAVGMKNEQVKVLQQYLAKDPTLYPEGTLDGYYGPAVVSAVGRFQQKYGIVTDSKSFGSAGPLTRTKLIEVFARTNNVVNPTPANPSTLSEAERQNLISQLRTRLISLINQLITLLAKSGT